MTKDVASSAAYPRDGVILASCVPTAAHLVPVRREADDEPEGADEHHPDIGVGLGPGRHHVLGRVRHDVDDDGERARHVAHLARAVREDDADGRHHLQEAEDELRVGVPLLGVGVDRRHQRVLLRHRVDVVVHAPHQPLLPCRRRWLRRRCRLVVQARFLARAVGRVRVAGAEGRANHGYSLHKRSQIRPECNRNHVGNAKHLNVQVRWESRCGSGRRIQWCLLQSWISKTELAWKARLEIFRPDCGRPRVVQGLADRVQVGLEFERHH